jgi:hypothetical protein
MKINKPSRRLVLWVVLLVSLIFLAAQVDAVRATFTDVHAFKVYLRVEAEIMQKTPAGQYYESLFWKHSDEFVQIMSAHPEHKEELKDAVFAFAPELEALLNGDGDKVYITAEDVEGIKSELDWLASVGSPVFRDDIDRERQRLQLDDMVGMSMNEALEFINHSVSSSSRVENTLVPDSDGRWAYIVHNGVYLEYPASYSVQISESIEDIVYFIPPTISSEPWNPCVIRVQFVDVPVGEQDIRNPRSRFSPESIVWENEIQNIEFPGYGFITSVPDWSVMDIHAYQYNEEKQLMVNIAVLANENPQLANPYEYSELINQRYEYFLHMLENLRVQ